MRGWRRVAPHVLRAAVTARATAAAATADAAIAGGGGGGGAGGGLWEWWVGGDAAAAANTLGDAVGRGGGDDDDALYADALATPALALGGSALERAAHVAARLLAPAPAVGSTRNNDVCGARKGFLP